MITVRQFSGVRRPLAQLGGESTGGRQSILSPSRTPASMPPPPRTIQFAVPILSGDGERPIFKGHQGRFDRCRRMIFMNPDFSVVDGQPRGRQLGPATTVHIADIPEAFAHGVMRVAADHHIAVAMAGVGCGSMFNLFEAVKKCL